MSTAFPDDVSFSLDHPAVQADVLALRDHARTTATAAHGMLAEQVWSALRGLGATGGRMLVRGLDPELLAGVPDHEHTLPSGQYGQLQGEVPHPGHNHWGPVLTEFEPGYTPGVFDVVLLNAPYADVVHHDGRFRLERWREHNQAILSCLAYTTPGGLVAALVSADVLDAIDPALRRGMAVLGDLLGAARLPGGALRHLPGCDNPVDLLLLRRRPGDQPARGARFETSVRLRLDGVPVHLNEYFHTRIGDVLGRPVLRRMPHGPPRLTVEPDRVSQNLRRDLRTTLDQIVRTATARGLTATHPTGHSTGRSTGTGPGPAPDLGARDDAPPGGSPHDPGRGPGSTPANPGTQHGRHAPVRPGRRLPRPPDAEPDRPSPAL